MKIESPSLLITDDDPGFRETLRGSLSRKDTGRCWPRPEKRRWRSSAARKYTCCCWTCTCPS